MRNSHAHLGVKDSRHDPRQLLKVRLSDAPPPKQAARQEQKHSVQPVAAVFPLILDL